MNVLVIGGCHVGNYGVQQHLGFVQQWATHLKVSTHEPVHLTCLSMVKLEHLPSLLSQYQDELTEADLIVLQLGHYELSWRKRFQDLFQPTVEAGRSEPTYQRISFKPSAYSTFLHKSPHKPERYQVKNRLKTALLGLHQATWGELPFLRQFRDKLTKAFAQLAAYQDKIVVLTPFPTLNRLDQWLRRASHPFLIEAAIRQGLRVADTFEAVPCQQPYFLADGVHLNSLGHMVVALFLSELPLPTEEKTQLSAVR
ncbi:SGNH/GDSL hydrolase family protein [Spirosoma koreense]